MMELTLWCQLLLLLSLTCKGVPTTYPNYDYENYFPQAGEVDPPIFTARPQTFTVEMGQSVIIPCDYTNSGVYKLIIKKLASRRVTEKLLAVNNEKIIPDERMAVTGARLTISQIRPRDAGTYLCRFDSEPPVQLKHVLDVQYAPNVRSLVPPEQHVVKGSSVTLECEAHGNPEPIIRWSRQGGKLPSGHHATQGSILSLTGVDHGAEGTFLCTADNGIGDPASAAMTITIEYPPEVTPEKSVVQTGEGDQIDLVCIVHGRPPPDVEWTRDGRPLPDSMMDTQLHLPSHHHHYTTSSSHPNSLHLTASTRSLPVHRHSLAITSVSEKDFGAYVCIAKNAHGQRNAVIQVTGLPQPPEVKSSPYSNEGSRYTITWTTNSVSAITQYIIKYHKTHLGSWQRNNSHVMGGAWNKVTKNVTPNDDVPSMSGPPTFPARALSHTLTNLDPATDYLALVRVRNKYGWSSESKIFQFSTKKAITVLQSTSGGEAVGVVGRRFWLLLTLPLLLLLLQALLTAVV